MSDQLRELRTWLEGRRARLNLGQGWEFIRTMPQAVAYRETINQIDAMLAAEPEPTTIKDFFTAVADPSVPPGEVWVRSDDDEVVIKNVVWPEYVVTDAMLEAAGETMYEHNWENVRKFSWITGPMRAGIEAAERVRRANP